MVLDGSAAAALATCDGKKLSTAAARLPKPKAAGANAACPIDEGRLDHEMLVHIVDKLIKYPRFTKLLHSVLYSNQCAITEEDGEEQDSAWTLGKVRSLKMAPRAWMASFLLGIYSKHGLASQTVNALKIIDGDALPMLLSLEMQVPLSSPLPKEMHGDPCLCSRIFGMRSELLNRRSGFLITGGGLLKTGVLWHKGGCYSLEFGTEEKANIVVGIVHNATKATASVPDHCPINKNFVLENNHSDSDAKVVLAPSSYLLHTFFAADVAFRKEMMGSKKTRPWKELLAKAGDEDQSMASAKRQAKELAETSRNALAASAKAKSMARTEKARVAIQSKQEERAKRRRITISTVAEGS